MMQKKWDSCHYSYSSEFCSSEDFSSGKGYDGRDHFGNGKGRPSWNGGKGFGKGFGKGEKGKPWGKGF